MKLNYRRKVCTADMNPYPRSLIEKGRIYGKHIPQFSLSLSLIKHGFSLYPDIYLYIDSVFFSIQSVVKECHTLLANADHTFFLPWAMSSLPLFLQYCDRLSNRDGYKP